MIKTSISYFLRGTAILLFCHACTGSVEIDVYTPPTGPLVWFADAYAKGNPIAPAARYGYSAAIAGSTAVIGAPGENANTGAVYVLSRGDSGWVQQARLVAPNGDVNDNFGSSVAISGDTIVVGATGEASPSTVIINGTGGDSANSAGQAGAVYVFRGTGSLWTQEAYLKAPNAETNDLFGYSVGISGDTIIAGAPGEASDQTTITNGTTASADNSMGSAGAAYIFRRTGTLWAQEAYLKAPNAGAGDEFGRAVAISGEAVVVGAYGEDENAATILNGTTPNNINGANAAGAAYVFRRSATTWSYEAYLKASNSGSGDEFGMAVAIMGDTIAVGAPKEDNSQNTVTNGTVISEPISSLYSGAVYIFRRSAGLWYQEAYLKASNTAANYGFGNSLSLTGDAIAVGSEQESSNQSGVFNAKNETAGSGLSNSGAVYIFRRNASIWEYEAFFKAGNPHVNARFGGAVAFSDSALIAGARAEGYGTGGIFAGSGAGFANSGTAYGAAYLFIRKIDPQ